jgi:hypothetical protein
MSKQSPPTPDPETQAMLDSLRLVAAKTLERKRRLGHYMVLWSGKEPLIVGDDAPTVEQSNCAHPIDPGCS